MEWKRVTEHKDNMFEIPGGWIHIHYYEALNVLFRVENSLRMFVYIILKNELLEKWAEINITSDDSESGTINSIARKRISQAGNFGYLGYVINCPLMYLTSGELIRLITSDAYWKYFKPYFLGSRDIIRNKLDEIGAIRNSLSHFRPIKPDDVDVIKQNAKHALVEIEECLSQIVSCHNVVPTNTQDEWYRGLGTLGTDLCTLQILQSKDERWIRFALRYRSPIILRKPFLGDSISFNILNLVSSAILRRYNSLTRLLTYLSESKLYTRMPPKGDPDFSKTVNMVFSRKVVENNYSSIKEDINNLLLLISEETELIQQDHLARGDLISMLQIYAWIRKDTKSEPYWKFDIDKMVSPLCEDDPPEYWCDLGFYQFDIISGTQKYPWMPVEISSFPF